ncbi:hypothetical protein [Hydrotalea sp.]|uniref:hypothetical protein n=1 Tax=Hydrotalea sp. TaxID=2881279 RepID=UPI002589CD8E|nr:hypothetical protein [Hydrotalea sp.]
MNKFTKCYFLIAIIFIVSCKDNSKQEIKKINTNDASNNVYRNYSDEKEDNNSEQEDNQDSENLTISSSNSDCNLSDGTYSSTVDYYNPSTGYSQTYTLDVEVEDCQVVTIYFPKGGWLDSDHITPAEIDEDGNAEVEGDEGRTYSIQIDK